MIPEQDDDIQQLLIDFLRRILVAMLLVALTAKYGLNIGLTLAFIAAVLSM